VLSAGLLPFVPSAATDRTSGVAPNGLPPVPVAPASAARTVAPASTARTGGATPGGLSLVTVAPASAARTDRRPVGGGVHDPRAGKTFISWGGFQEDNYVQEYDHRRHTWSAPMRVAGGDNDSHNYPTLIQADDGHLLVFRGLHNRELWVARSPRPHSIEGTWTDTIIPEGLGATYPMPVKTSDGTIFVFIRETAGDFDPNYPTDTRPMKYVRSVDNGLTWQSSAALTGDRWCIAPLNRPDNMNEIYIGQLRHEPATPAHPATAAHNPTTRGRRWRGHACPISASVAGMTNAAPAPATMRHTTIGSGPSVNAGAIDAIANTLSPPSKAERRPYRSPMAPAGNSRHASATV